MSPPAIEGPIHLHQHIGHSMAEPRDLLATLPDILQDTSNVNRGAGMETIGNRLSLSEFIDALYNDGIVFLIR